MKAFKIVLPLLLPLAALPGCNMREVAPVVRDVAGIAATVVADVQQANIWLDIIAAAAHAMLGRAAPDADAKFSDVERRAKLALVALNDLATGTEQATQEQFDLAYANFKAAWRELLQVGKAAGVVVLKGVKAAPRNGVPPVEEPVLRLAARP